MEEFYKSGVYVIEHLASGKKYVGSAGKSFKQRWGDHRNKLRKGSHHSRHLQRAWSKFGERAFEFRILEVTKPEQAVAVEQTFIDWYKSADTKHGYNISPTAGSSRGVKQSSEVRAAHSIRRKITHRTPEFRAAQSARLKIAKGTPEARAAQSVRSKNTFESTEYRAAHRERQKIAGCTPEARAAASVRQKILQGTPEARAANSERKKALHADPVRKAAYMLKRKTTIKPKRLTELKPDEINPAYHKFDAISSTLPEEQAQAIYELFAQRAPPPESQEPVI